MEKFDIVIVKHDVISQHRQIAVSLKNLIICGIIKKREMLPGERTLAKHLNVSRDVVHRAYKLLKEEKIIELYSSHKGHWIPDSSDEAASPNG